MRLFRKQISGDRPLSTASTKGGSSNNNNNNIRNSATSSTAPPIPNRTSRHDDLYTKIMQEVQLEEQAQGLPSGELIDKHRSFRHGSVVVRLDHALAESKKNNDPTRPRSKELAGLVQLVDTHTVTTTTTTSTTTPTTSKEDNLSTSPPMITSVTTEGEEETNSPSKSTITITTNDKVDVSVSVPIEEQIQIQAPVELYSILASPRLRFEFRHFLRKKYAVESLLMFEAIELYESVPEAARSRVGEGIIDRFIKDSAIYAVNISGIERRVLLEVMQTKAWDHDTFRPVQRELYHLMSSNFFRDFVDIHWPGGILLASPGVFLSDFRREGSSATKGSGVNNKGSGAVGGGGGRVGTGVGGLGGRLTDVSTLTSNSDQHIHDDETEQSLAFLEV
jgi:hypothetical protein